MKDPIAWSAIQGKIKTYNSRQNRLQKLFEKQSQLNYHLIESKSFFHSATDAAAAGAAAGAAGAAAACAAAFVFTTIFMVAAAVAAAEAAAVPAATTSVSK